MGQGATNDLRNLMKSRTLFVGVVITLMFLGLVGKVFWVQVVQGAAYLERAKTYWLKSEKLTAVRGAITDRHDNYLALNAPVYHLSLNPQVLKDLKIEEQVVDKLSELLGKDKQEILQTIGKKREDGTLFVEREIRPEGQNMDKELYEKLKAFNDELAAATGSKHVGINFTQSEMRYYPNASLAAQLLGYVDRDQKAVSGIEANFDKELTGADGWLKYYSDGRIGIDDEKVEYNPVQDGNNIALTIDKTIQYFVEEALDKIQADYQPKSATVVVADPSTMEILALANRPTYNPNRYWETKDFASFYNHAIKSEYEPGSTFKIVTLAGAVEEGLFDPEETYLSGSIKVPGRTIHDINRDGWGTISYLEGLKRSSNVAFIKLGYGKLGPERLSAYISKFGFGEKTNIELAGEAAGVINMKYSADFAAASYGQGIQVTPIQQVAAVAAVANGGKLLEPHIIKSIHNPTTNTTIQTEPKLIRQVISPETSEKVGSYLEQVVSDKRIGSGKKAAIDGIRVAGKTGTANKVINGKYAKGKHVVSFIGYAPVEKPRLVVLVIVDEPNEELGGGTVAAPVFKEIVEQSLTYMGIAAASPSEDGSAASPPNALVPDVKGLSVQQAKQRLEETFAVTVLGNGTTVKQVFPQENSRVANHSRIYLLADDIEKLSIPDLQGMSLLDALNICKVYKLKVSIQGEGYVTSQHVTGSGDNRSIELTLEPQEQLNKLHEEQEKQEKQVDQ